MENLFKECNKEYFNGRLSPTVLDLLSDLPKQNQEVQDFVERMFKFMKTAHFPAIDFSHYLAWFLSSILPQMLPGGWNGMVPPVTQSQRHRKIDKYMKLNPWSKVGPRKKLLDLGCGFPPMTAIDTAKSLKKWNIIGADPSFAYFMVYDKNGDYASFNKEGELFYFQSGVLGTDDSEELYQNPDITKERFTKLLNQLLPYLPNCADEEYSALEREGIKLIKNPVKEYEQENLSFMRGGIGQLDIEDVDVVRCFNVLFYFDREFRNKTLNWIEDILKPGGLFLCGTNGPVGSECKYTIYRKEGNRLEEKEFAFSVDNLRPIGIVTWYALHDDDYETCMVVEAMKVIRSDSEFLSNFDKALDAVLSELEMCPREKDGYLGGIDPKTPPEESMRRFLEIERLLDKGGYVDGAVSVLKRAGYEAWRNCVDHIAIDPKSLRN